MKKTILICALAAGLAACAGKQQNTAAADTVSARPSTTTQSLKMPVMPPPSAASQAPSPDASKSALTGEIAETMDAGGYTYLRIKTAQGDVWAAVKQTKVKVGSTVAVDAQLTMEKFQSPSLKRTFDHIVFGALVEPGATPAAMMPAGGAMMPGGTSTAAAGDAAQHMKGGAANVGDVSVPKATGANARTVAETWAGRADIKDKPVVIRGKVVKFLAGIMGRNWIHLRDGSGSGAKGDNDITVTTKDTAAVGDVVVVSGVARVNKDFGAGYQYPVIIEDAKVTK